MKITLLTVFVLLLIWLPWAAFGFFIYAPFLEWNLHRHLMHTKRKWFSYPFEAHTITHHGMYRGDEKTYVAHEGSDEKKIPMAWWNGLVMTAISTIPFAIIGYLNSSKSIPIQIFCAVGLYYCTYEYFHWCMHLPKQRWFECKQWYKNLNERHRLHHVSMGKNMNVILPVWDIFRGTYLAPFKSSR